METQDDEGKPSTSQGSGSETESSEDDDSVEKCPVCLAKIKDQDVGTPESCDHSFCLECIVEWSKVIKYTFGIPYPTVHSYTISGHVK